VKASRKTQTAVACGLCFREAFAWRTPAGSAGRPSRSAQRDVFFVCFVSFVPFVAPDAAS